MRANIASIGLVIAIGCAAIVAASAQEEDPLWSRADGAYSTGNIDDGHAFLKQLIDSRPGDADLAVRCLKRILGASGRLDSGDPWVRFAVKRLAALERIGALPANSAAAYRAHEIGAELSQQDGRPLEVVEELDRLAAENPHALQWELLRARTHRHLDTTRARPLYEALKRVADPGHPDTEVREIWQGFETELATDLDSLPQPILAPLPNSSPLIDAEPDDPDGRWRKVADGSPSQITEEIDRLAGEVLEPDQVVPWRDMSGLLDPVRALDLHLLSQPPAQLAELRTEQADGFSFELVPESPTEAEVLALWRRYPWGLPAQKLLLEQAHDYLWAGRAESARRCFQELLAHAIDPEVIDAAQVGSWVVQAQVGQHEALVAAVNATDPEKDFPWMGETATALEIRSQLLLLPDIPQKLPLAAAPAMGDLKQQAVHLPPVPAWPANDSAAGLGIDLRVIDKQLIVSSRNLLASYDAATAAAAPTWAQIQRHPLEDRQRTGYHPGYFRPSIAADGATIYTRWGLASLPDGIAAFDRASGQPLWASEPNSGSGYRFAIPMGDPVSADGGKLFFLQWNTRGDVNDARGRELSLVCFDPQTRSPLWESTIAKSGSNSDIVASLERASPASAIYGNRVTVHQGAIYSCSNAGLVACSDVRDGRSDWIHFYRRNSHAAAGENLGCAPLVAGDKLICMPRDAARVFALDLKTGRLIWDNPLTSSVECLGLVGDLLILRGTHSLSALDATDGDARWYRPVDTPIIGRTQLIGDSVYFAQGDRLNRLDARSGAALGSRPWELGDQRALSFAIDADKLYVVSDQPADDAVRRVAQALNPGAQEGSAALGLPLKNTWSLQRSEATIALPPDGSPLDGTAFLLSGGILECVELTPQGGIRWQRFVSATGASLHLAGDKLLLVEGRRGAAVARRAIAFDAKDGRVVWDKTTIPHQLSQTLRCGSRQLFHDGRSAIAAIDLATGKLAWQRHFGIGQLLKPHWDGTHLHVFHTTLRRGAIHLELSPDTGENLSDHRVEIKMVEGVATNGRPIDNGYFEVAFKPVQARFIRLTTRSEINGREWASAAELHVVGADAGTRLPRDGWTATTDSYETQSTRYTPSADKAIDGDPTSWWHSKWLDGIPDHPHHVAIDFGSVQTVSALHYLPAVIVNNNGMIRDYEIHVSSDGEGWGDPVAEGIMVNRVHIDRAFFADSGAMFFESRDHRTRTTSVFRYALDGKSATVIAEDARVLDAGGRYVLLSVKKDKKEILAVLDANDPDYRFELEPQVPHNRSGQIYFEGDRLILAEQIIVIADLKTKSFTIEPGEDKLPHNRNGQVVRIGPDALLKFVNEGQRGQALTHIDLLSGKLSSGTLTTPGEATQIARFRQTRQNSQQRALLSFNGTMLYYDGSVLSAWTTSTSAVPES